MVSWASAARNKPLVWWLEERNGSLDHHRIPLPFYYVLSLSSSISYSPFPRYFPISCALFFPSPPFPSITFITIHFISLLWLFSSVHFLPSFFQLSVNSRLSRLTFILLSLPLLSLASLSFLFLLSIPSPYPHVAPLNGSLCARHSNISQFFNHWTAVVSVAC